MSTKILVVVSTGDKDTVLSALMYAGAAIRNKWMEDVKVIYLGPSEILMVEDEEVAVKVKEINKASLCYACQTISDREGISDRISELGVRVELVGARVSELIKDGYVPLVF
jgi:hypothetical protein